MKTFPALFVLLAAQSLPAAFELKDQPGEYLEVRENGRAVARYMYSSDFSTPELRHDHYKPFLHVMDAAGSAPITKGPGGAFTHHRGIFLGWSKLKVGEKVYDRWHMKGGEQIHRRFTGQEADAHHAGFTSLVEWTGDNGIALREERSFQFLTPPAGSLLLVEMRSVLHAVGGETLLDGDPEHAGLQFRPAGELDPAETQFLYPRENAEPHKDRDYPWVGEEFTLAGKRYGVVFLNHPDNPKQTPFSAYRDYGRFGAWFKDAIPAGGKREIKVRFMVSANGLPEPGEIQKQANAFTGLQLPVPGITRAKAEAPKKPEPKKPEKSEPKPAAAVPEKAAAPVQAPALASATKETQKVLAGGSEGEKSAGPRRAGGGPENPVLKFHPPVPEVLTAEQALQRLKLPKGFHAELVASEPMIESPVAVSWDAKGRLYVVEMRGYMHDMEAKGEDQPIGRISRLEDTDGDGRMDKSTVFVDQLLMPRAVMALGDGALVGVPPRLLWYHDTNGDGVADRHEEVVGDFGKEGGQPEHMANSPLWMRDNWIQCAGYGQRLRLERGQWTVEPTVPGGQWGLTQDDWGRPFFNYNSALLHADLVPPKWYTRNPHLTLRTGLNRKLVTDGICWPSHPTPGVNRGYIEETTKPDGTKSPGTLREDGTLRSVTATCGAAVYRGGLFPKEYQGNVFAPEPSGNLVKRIKLEESGGVIQGRNALEDTEFLTSTDERFRPVNAYTGPDGALYIVDFARGIIQHKAFLTYYLAANIQERKLEQPIGLGRIYRIVPDAKKPKFQPLGDQPALWVDRLNDPNGWVRDTAQQLLVERADMAVVPALEKLALHGPTPQARVHALWTLDGLRALQPTLVTAALADREPKVRVAAVRLADRTLLPELLKLLQDKNPEVRLQLAFALSPQPGQETALIQLLEAGGSLLLGEAVVSGLAGRELEFLETLVALPVQKQKTFLGTGVFPLLSGAVIAEHRSARTARLLELVSTQPARSPLQAALLEGMAGKPLAKGAKPRLVYLDEEPAALAKLLATPDSKTRSVVQTVAQKLAWPGKPGVPPKPVVQPLTPAQEALYEKGRTIYTGICAGCHQPGGSGLEGLAPPLVDSDWVLGPADRAGKIILHGLNGPVTVSGVVWRLEMPALGQLSDEDIAGVLTYIRREWEHGASPVTPADVARWRSENADRNRAWTADELKKPAAPKNTAAR
jgi:mono/diheme cytochrome c family protein/glucose/arabinose dehydrogenase